MADPDSFSRLSRWALGAAALIAAGSVGWRLHADRVAATAAVDEAQAGNAGDGVAALEARIREHPGDASAWEALGTAFAAGQRYGDAASAFRRAVQLRPGAADLWSALGEALAMGAAQDPMPAEALAAFRKAHELDRKNPRARYFLAVAREVAGDPKGAIDDWLALLTDTPAGAPWEANLRRTIERVADASRIDVAARLAAVKQPAAQGPTQEQVQAAAAMSPEEQRKMAEGMVEQLAARLQAEPKRVDGWLLLIRSRMSLAQPDKAKAALEAAVKANPDQAAQIREQAAALGVK